MPSRAPRTGPIGKAAAISPSPHSAEPPPRTHSLVAAFGFAFAGLAAAWRSQRNFRVHLAIAALVLVAGALLRLSALGWAVVVLAIALVLAAELANTAIEALVDLVSPGDHPLAQRAKDVAAAGVLVASLGAAAAGLLVAIGTLANR
jgi:diacylglycerol kinase